MQHAIKTCPFCKGEAIVAESFDSVRVKCRKCKASTRSFSIKKYGKAAVAKAVEAWNQRADSVEKD